jgi:nucleoside-diphosphate-sugar epimerase
MNILVIGATGYIGSRVAAVLADAGHQVTALRRRGGTAPPRRYRTVEGELSDPPTLISATAGFDRVIHIGVPIDDETDLAGVDALLAAGSPVVYTTGAAVLGPGIQDEDSVPDPHPIAAIRPEIERRVLAADGWVIRPGLVYGHGGGLVHGLLAGKAAERGTGVYIGGRGVRWPVVHVDDLVALYLAVVSGAAPGTIWHGISETSRLDAIAEALGNGTATSWPADDAAKEIGSLLADLFTRDQEVLSDKTRQNLGWSPVHTSIVAYLAGSRQEDAPGTAGSAGSPRGPGRWPGPGGDPA